MHPTMQLVTVQLQPQSILSVCQSVYLSDPIVLPSHSRGHTISIFWLGTTITQSPAWDK